MRLHQTLPSEPASIPHARAVLDRLRPSLDELTWRNGRLALSEVVTNAVRHGPDGGAASIEVVMEAADGRLRVEVADAGWGFVPRPRDPEQGAGSGWGLHILDLVASRWGVEREPRSRVWFEVAPGMSPREPGRP
jgi:anti-sigma regulatory factor (Ser/Thr protein kinase)